MVDLNKKYFNFLSAPLEETDISESRAFANFFSAILMVPSAFKTFSKQDQACLE